ncbi:DUF397 domain-containing protein [Actinomadura sp. WMMB 499]|uniref:DUF397 domain-containing protein n=1 Tax=Actinomadura sp. WMMB 499 TaxID=1219491 RepID=UPI0012440F0A|nr:DUF397 domain-containing protein [Actinomadura sp. WMMB 499]QFG20986.1 DUF397 domain-containing protein [Actinomadura sp. WMMB 499]
MTKPRKPTCPSSPWWRKSSYSQPAGDDCVEVAEIPGQYLVRDSKDPNGPRLTLTPSAWTTLLTTIKTGTRDIR